MLPHISICFPESDIKNTSITMLQKGTEVIIATLQPITQKLV